MNRTIRKGSMFSKPSQASWDQYQYILRKIMSEAKKDAWLKYLALITVIFAMGTTLSP